MNGSIEPKRPGSRSITRIVKRPNQVARCFDTAVAGHSRGAIDLMAPSSLRRRTMSRRCFRLVPIALLLTLASAARAADFRDLFDGRSLDGWIVEGPAKDKTGRPMWSVDDGRIV